MDSLTKLHSSIFHPVLRKLQENNVEISTHNIMYPVFIIDGDDQIEDIPSMPNVKRYGINQLKLHLEKLVKDGLQSILMFGVINSSKKNSNGDNADSIDNSVVRALPLLRKWYPNLLLACDVCLCPYTDHGHCGILTENGIDNELSIKRIAEISLAYAKAGAHIVAPSDMMDNRIHAIKKILNENQLGSKVSVLSYSVKFASSFYGPFRDAAQSAPAFGDRKCYQLPYGSRSIGIRAAQRDVEEGADMLMVKPGMAYLDVVRDIKNNHPNYPLFIYQVSGEYSMLLCAAEKGIFQLKPMLLETLVAMRRAGADCIITYFAPTLLEWMKGSGTLPLRD